MSASWEAPARYRLVLMLGAGAGSWGIRDEWTGQFVEQGIEEHDAAKSEVVRLNTLGESRPMCSDGR